MTDKPLKDVGASVRQRLLNLARQRGEQFQRILTLYALERLLYRISQSEHRETFILKGALLFVRWSDQPARATNDMDLLGSGSPSPGDVQVKFRQICTTSVVDDGLTFPTDALSATVIRKDARYVGVRVTLIANLDRARIPVQVDVGFGDAVYPDPEEAPFPTLLPFPAPHLRMYRPETTIAEKLSALVTLGRENTRLKDYFDFYLLARDFEFEYSTLRAAVVATFARQGTPLPTDMPVGLSDGFASDASKQSQWSAFVRQKVKQNQRTPDLPATVQIVRAFLLPVLVPPTEAEYSDARWLRTPDAPGSWQKIQ